MAKRSELIRHGIKKEKRFLIIARIIAFAELIILVGVFSLLIKILGLKII